MEIVQALPNDLVKYIYEFLPNKRIDEIQRARRSIRKTIGLNMPYRHPMNGTTITIYNLQTKGGLDMYNKQRMRYLKLTMKLWDVVDDHYCRRCGKHHQNKNDLVTCTKCGSVECKYQYRLRNKRDGWDAITNHRLVKNPVYKCVVCEYSRIKAVYNGLLWLGTKEQKEFWILHDTFSNIWLDPTNPTTLDILS